MKTALKNLLGTKKKEARKNGYPVSCYLLLSNSLFVVLDFPSIVAEVFLYSFTH
jgi:hypothetical protein